MTFHLWTLFFLAYLVTTLSPGPNVLLVLKNSIQFGWKSAFITIFGNLTCQFLIVCLVALGVGALLQTLPVWFVVMKILGGSYLIYLGIKALRSKKNQPLMLSVIQPQLIRLKQDLRCLVKRSWSLQVTQKH